MVIKNIGSSLSRCVDLNRNMFSTIWYLGKDEKRIMSEETPELYKEEEEHCILPGILHSLHSSLHFLFFIFI